MNALREHIEQLSYRAIPKSALGKAVRYALHQWEPPTVFLSDGALAIGRVEHWRGWQALAPRFKCR